MKSLLVSLGFVFVVAGAGCSSPRENLEDAGAAGVPGAAAPGGASSDAARTPDAAVVADAVAVNDAGATPAGSDGAVDAAPAARLPTGTLRMFPLGGRDLASSAIALGPDGNVWFSASPGRVYRVTPDGAIDVVANMSVGQLALGPDGNVWFISYPGGVGHITPAGMVTTFNAPPWTIPVALAADKMGHIWVAAASESSPSSAFKNKLLRYSTDGASIEFPLADFRPKAIAVGPDGNLWLLETSGRRIRRVTVTGEITGFLAPYEKASPSEVIAGPNDDLWYTDSSGRLGRISTAGVVTEYPHAGGYGSGITLGPDGNLWFASPMGQNISRMTPKGEISVYPVPDQRFPRSITVGADGNLWFTTGYGAIGRISP